VSTTIITENEAASANRRNLPKNKEISLFRLKVGFSIYADNGYYVNY